MGSPLIHLLPCLSICSRSPAASFSSSSTLSADQLYLFFTRDLAVVGPTLVCFGRLCKRVAHNLARLRNSTLTNSGLQQHTPSLCPFLFWPCDLQSSDVRHRDSTSFSLP